MNRSDYPFGSTSELEYVVGSRRTTVLTASDISDVAVKFPFLFCSLLTCKKSTSQFTVTNPAAIVEVMEALYHLPLANTFSKGLYPQSGKTSSVRAYVLLIHLDNHRDTAFTTNSYTSLAFQSCNPGGRKAQDDPISIRLCFHHHQPSVQIHSS